MIKQFIKTTLFPKSNSCSYLSVLSVALFFLILSGVRSIGVATFKADPILISLIAVPSLIIVGMASYVFKDVNAYNEEDAKVSQMMFSGFVWGAVSIIPITNSFNNLSNQKGVLYLILVVIASIQFVRVLFLVAQNLLVSFIRDRYIWGESPIRRFLDSLTNAYRHSFTSDTVTWHRAVEIIIISFLVSILCSIFVTQKSFQPLMALIISSEIINVFRNATINHEAHAKKT